MTRADAVPELLVVVDTEEEFDWSKPFDCSSIATSSVPAQALAHELFDRMGIVPTYVVDYPVATNVRAVRFLRALRDDGRAEIGAHLHSWVTPPRQETVTSWNSYQCNLPSELERAKIDHLTEAVELAFGERPVIFKAGRYGLGSRTARHLAELGYQVDCSVLPCHDLGKDGGPDFTRFPDQPYWSPEAPSLLEIPATAGLVGAAPRLGRLFPSLFDSCLAARLRIPGLLARSGIVARSRLTPEGIAASEQCRLLDRLVRTGRSTFSLFYHSPSLVPGHTPYVRSQADLRSFLMSLETVLNHFRDSLGGRFTTLSAVHARMSAERAAAGIPPGAALSSCRAAPPASPSAADLRPACPQKSSPDTSAARPLHRQARARYGS